MASDTSDKYMLARITRRQEYSPTLWSVWMKPPEELVFKAGQYVAFGVDHNEKVLERRRGKRFVLVSGWEGLLKPGSHRGKVGPRRLCRNARLEQSKNAIVARRTAGVLPGQRGPQCGL